MRALLIDPHKREIREVDHDFNSDYSLIKQLLGAGELGDKKAPLCAGPRFTRDVHSYVDDEGYYRPGQAWFWIKGYGNPLAGYCLIIGDSEEGDEAPLPDWFTIDRLATLVMWTDPGEAMINCPPVRVTTLGPDGPKVVGEYPIDFTDVRPL